MWVKSVKAVGSSEEQEHQRDLQNVDKTRDRWRTQEKMGQSLKV